MSIERLSAEDRLMLAASEAWPQDIGAVAILDGTALLDPSGRFRIEAARKAIEARLDLVPRLRQVIHAPGRGLGPPLWVDVPAFEIADHVGVVPLPMPGDEAGLLSAVERLRREPLDRSRPPWGIWFMTGLPDRRIALFVRLHHAIADGMAAMTTVATFLDAVPDPPARTTPPWTPAPWPSTGRLLSDNLRRRTATVVRRLGVLAWPWTSIRRLRAAWPAIRELLAEEPATATSLDRVVGPDRSLAVVRTSLDPVMEIARTHHATVNDVLLAVTAAGVSALLHARGEPVENVTVRVYVPVSLRPASDGPRQGNLIAQMVVPISLGDSDAGSRLRQIAAETTARKVRARTSLGMLFPGGITRRLMLKAVIRQRVNVTTASIPGPERPLFLAGAQVTEVFPVLPLIGNVPLGVGALSYAGTLDIGVAADRDAFPDIDVLITALTAELQTLTEGTPRPGGSVVARA